MKVLGCHTQGKLDTDKLVKCSGQIVEIIAKHKGFRDFEGKKYHKVTLRYTGAAPELLPVDESVKLPDLPGSVLTTTATLAKDPFATDDLPF
jgi:hypothetical protein